MNRTVEDLGARIVRSRRSRPPAKDPPSAPRAKDLRRPGNHAHCNASGCRNGCEEQNQCLSRERHVPDESRKISQPALCLQTKAVRKQTSQRCQDKANLQTPEGKLEKRK